MSSVLPVSLSLTNPITELGVPAIIDSSLLADPSKISHELVASIVQPTPSSSLAAAERLITNEQDHSGAAQEKAATAFQINVLQSPPVSKANAASIPWVANYLFEREIEEGRRGSASYTGFHRYDWKRSRVFDGPGHLRYSDGCYTFVGGFKDGCEHGIGMANYKDLSSEIFEGFQGEWKKSCLDGFGCFIQYDGLEMVMQYKGEWRDHQQEGIGQLEKKESKYEGYFRGAQRTGYGKEVYSDGSVYEGHWKEDKFHGFGVHTSTEGIERIGLWEAGEFKGEWAHESSGLELLNEKSYRVSKYIAEIPAQIERIGKRQSEIETILGEISHKE